MQSIDEISFKYDNLTCCSLKLYWKIKSKKANHHKYSYKLYQKEGSDSFIANLFYFEMIYEGDDTTFEVINLKPDQQYTFKLEVIKNSEKSDDTIMEVKTLKSPNYIISDKSMKIANGEKFENKSDLTDVKIKLIKNCCKLIFTKKKENKNILKGNFDGIKMKITYESSSKIYYISFDIKSKYYIKFYKQYLKERGNNLLIPCHFVIEKLPTILIFNLLEKSPVLFTGKGLGGMLASSLTFYILYIGKKLGINYENVFIKRKEKSLGAVTFGSPAFLSNLTAAIKMQAMTPYFSHIKNEFDFIPQIIDFLETDDEILLNILNKKVFDNNDIKALNVFWGKNGITLSNLKNNIKNYPFGYYYEMNSVNSDLKFINENSFDKFYYNKIFENPPFKQCNVNDYKNLSLFKAGFNKEYLKFLENENYELKSIKIIRRKIAENSTKGIIKFKLQPFGQNIISPDIIKNIKLIAFNDREYIIEYNNIYYDNESDITGYIDNLNDNIKEVEIINNFGGKIKVKNKLNIQGSGQTREMLKDNIEKLFLFPFFKLFEIFYISLNDKKKYNELKKEDFGNNFSKLNILNPFKDQIITLNELFLLTRPDLLGKYENKFINEYINEEHKNGEMICVLSDQQINYLKNNY